jgi:hypothetical protein
VKTVATAPVKEQVALRTGAAMAAVVPPLGVPQAGFELPLGAVKTVATAPVKGAIRRVAVVAGLMIPLGLWDSRRAHWLQDSVVSLFAIPDLALGWLPVLG